MSRTLTGTLLLPDGTPLPNAKIYLTAKRTEAASIVGGVNTFFTTNSSGAYSATIVNGYYSVSLEYLVDATGTNLRRWTLGDIVVETAATTTLEALLVAADPGSSVEETLLYSVLTDCQNYASAAATSAANAANSAASVTKITGTTDLVAGHVLDNRGWMGLGASGIVESNYNNISGNRFIYGSNAILNKPSTFSYTVGLNLSNASGYESAQIVVGTYGNPGLAYRARYSSVADTYYSWRYVWDSSNLANPATIDTSQVISGAKTFSNILQSTSKIYINKTGDGIDFQRIGMSSGGGYCIYGRDTATDFVRLYQTDSSGNLEKIVFNASRNDAIKLYFNGNIAAATSANGLDVTGKLTASGGVVMPSYTVSTVPSASANANVGIIVTNPSSGGRRPYWSDGTNWYDAAHTLLA